jgi:predicted membrane protein
MTAASAFRLTSLLIGLAVTVSLMLFPFLLRHVPPANLHLALPILMLGVAGSMVYGIGYTPDNRVLRALFGPLCSWSLIFGGLFLLLCR